MADIRINALATTAASTASDDFVAVDGSANGTRKLNAYSPTFGGNLTVSGGTATLGSDASLVRQGNGWVQIANTSGSFAFGGYSVTTNRTDNYVGLRAINNTGGTSFVDFGVGSTATGDGLQNYGYIFTGAGLNGIRLFTNGSTTAKLTIDNAGLTTLAGNLTVSGTGGLILSSATPTISSSATNASLSYTSNGTGNHNFNNAINVNGVNGVGKLNARAETDGNLHTRAYSLINGSGTGVALDALNDANNSLTGFYIRGNAIKLGGGPVTITDNLTVSGTANALGGTYTGNSEVLALRGSGTTAQFRIAGAGADYVKYLALGFNTTSNYGWIDANQAGTGVKPLVVNPSGGNLLLGTTTDSGNGKLQLATHTTSAGGIGFGTRIALHSAAANQITITDLTGTNPYLGFNEGANPKLQLFTLSSTAYLSTVGATPLILRTNETTALTLDSSQNATFAGQVTSKGTVLSVNTGLYTSDATLSSYATNNGVYLNGHAGGFLLLSGSGGGGSRVKLNGGTGAGATIIFSSNNNTTALTVDGGQNIIPGTAALATTATDGFIYLQTCAGTPTGVPTSYTGRVASIYDTTNNKLYIYNGGWKSVTLA